MNFGRFQKPKIETEQQTEQRRYDPIENIKEKGEGLKHSRNIQQDKEVKKRKSAIIRVVGGEEGLEQRALAEAEKFFERKQEFKEHEIEKTPEQKEIITFLNERLPEFIEKYGGQPIGVSEDKVHVISEEFWERGKMAGYYVSDPRENSVYIKKIENAPFSAFAKTLVHEFMHFNFFQSATAYKGIRRGGFTIGGEKDGEFFSFFQYLNEAVTEELTKRFCEMYLKKISALKEEREKFEDGRAKAIASGFVSEKDAGDIAYEATEEGGGIRTHRLISYSYKKEREQLNHVIDELYTKNKDQFQSKEEVFALFADAVMSGRLLPIARLIEKTRGKGSFRKIGEGSGGKPRKITEDKS